MPETDGTFRLAVVLSHPTQYYSPWFRHLALRPGLTLKVFYLWESGVKETRDRTFGTSFAWDIPLLDGYDSVFLPNRARVPGTHQFRGLDNPAAVAAVAGWNPDAVLLFGYAYRTHLRLVSSPRLARTPFWFRGDSHELAPGRGWKPAAARLMRRLLFRRFDRFLAVGTANADYFKASGVAAGRIRCVPHCVDNDRFQEAAPQAATEAARWRADLGIPAGATVVLFAGKLEEKKRPLDLLRAFLKVREQDSAPSAVLLYVGSGPLEKELRSAAASHTGRSVFFAPFQNQSAMPKVYAAGDVLVLPSHGRGETWGLAVNEAMNLARPVIVSSHVGCGPDLVAPGQTGWTFAAGDVAALEQVLSEALADPAALRAAGARARERIGAFSYQVAGDRLMEVVRESTK